MSKDTAQQEVEKVCFAYEKAGETGNIKDWGKFYDLEDSLIKKVEVANQPKLSIPKKIAELLDIGYACEGDEERDHSWLIHNMDDFTSPESYDEFYNWLEDSEDNYSLAIAYLAGKALGVELVNIEED
ncbi:hypothetical protein NGA55_06895 [Lactococcus formosensis]|uniref:hypothetical protein n=1 Tax=Lactococcus formosensis TaxID=1281486 RepID=UPI0002E90715|nr:hypothetical protein [Lactococcus formosensis]MDG6128694.1 hypothetical protein [Lactococcus formosensis]